MRPPPNTLSYCRNHNKNATLNRRKIELLSGFFAHEYFKSRALRAKTWRLLHTHTLKNRYERVNPLKLPQSVQATLWA